MRTIHDYARMLLRKTDIGEDGDVVHAAFVLINRTNIKESEDFEFVIEQMKPFFNCNRTALSKFRFRYKIYKYNECNQKSKKHSTTSSKE